MTSKDTARRLPILGLVWGLAPNLAMAHAGHEPTGLVSGLLHPPGGIDHLLAMLAVGLWAFQLHTRRAADGAGQSPRFRPLPLWALPAVFLLGLTAGGVLGASGLNLPMVESGIALSVLLLGFMLGMAWRLASIVPLLLVGLFGLLHGHAHGAEMPANTAALAYFCGFLVSSLMLHVGGMGLACALQRLREDSLRLAGLGLSVAGLGLVLG